MPESRKKVIVRTVTGTIHAGYLPLAGILSPGAPSEQPSLGLLDLNARILAIPFPTVRSVAYVRDFNLADKVDPERLSRRSFLARPRSEGLWLRLTLSGGDTLEGLAAIDLSLVDALLEDRGLFLIPPDIRSNTQRVYIPRHAITRLHLLAVVTTHSKTRLSSQQAAKPPQESLFE